MTNQKIISLNLTDFPVKGLYLIFDDQNRVDMIPEHIERISNEYWSDPQKIPEELKNDEIFMPCEHCPEFGNKVLCKALRPIFPYLDKVDKYMSYDKVTCVYRDDDPEVLYVSYTTVQRALVYISMLSMVFYCEMSEKYSQYLKDINPFTSNHLISKQIYANMYVEHNGDLSVIEPLLTDFKQEIFESTECLVKRLRKICKNDAFINAFINAHVIIDAIDMKYQ